MTTLSKRPASAHPDPAYWAAIRAHRLEIANYCCEACGARTQLECHHRTYDRFGSENYTDLLMLCRPCHQAITASVRGRRGMSAGTNTVMLIGLFGYMTVLAVVWFASDSLSFEFLAAFWTFTIVAGWLWLLNYHPWAALGIFAFISGLIGGLLGGRR